MIGYTGSDEKLGNLAWEKGPEQAYRDYMINSLGLDVWYHNFRGTWKKYRMGTIKKYTKDCDMLDDFIEEVESD